MKDAITLSEIAHSREATEESLCALMILTGCKLSDRRCRVVFETLVIMYLAGVEIDLITLVDELSRRGRLEEAGGAQFVGSIVRML